MLPVAERLVEERWRGDSGRLLVEGVGESAQQLCATEWLIGSDTLQNTQGAHTSYVSSGIVQSIGESKRHLEKRADPWVQITSLIRFTRTPDVQQYIN